MWLPFLYTELTIDPLLFAPINKAFRFFMTFTLERSAIFVPLLLALLMPARAVEPPVPPEFIGTWTPINSVCQNPNKLHVEASTVSLINGSDFQQFGDLDICYNCEGGARYQGQVVWLLPEFNTEGRAPFMIRFNANEEKGVAIIEMEREDLKKRFPLHNIKLRKCQN